MNRVSNNDLFKRLQSMGNEKGVSITYTTKVFYISLLDYAAEFGEETALGLSFELSVKDMAKKAGVSDGMSEKAIKALSESGVILRNKITSKKVITILVRSVYEA